MTRRSVHYEAAFEHVLRTNRVPYIAVDEARKTLLPADADLDELKSFDFLVQHDDRRLLIDVKGRRFTSGRQLDSWVTRSDVESLVAWQRLFGPPYEAVFVFMYALRDQPPDALFESIFACRGVWYALREVAVTDYQRAMCDRSRRWATVHVRRQAFDRISRPLDLQR